jgi:hypothetical protein
MTGKDAIRTALMGTQQVLNWYISDLSDADLLVRPAPNANHIAWQLGHLINSEIGLLGPKNVPGATYPELPAGFADQHGKGTAAAEPPKGFLSKEEYSKLFNRFRSASLENLAKLSDSDLDKPITGDMAKFAPTLGALFLLESNHTLMHAGQFTVVRRKLGRPVLF